MALIMASNSFLVTHYCFSGLFSVRLKYAITISSPCCTWDRTAPIAQLLASVLSMNGASGSGYAITGASVSASFSC